MTDNEIIKALECCEKQPHCTGCPYFEKIGCKKHLYQDALDLINRQEAEIERLMPFGCQVEVSKKIEQEIKTEAIKKAIAELYNSFRQYENHDTFHTYEILDRIESVEEFLLKEMMEIPIKIEHSSLCETETYVVKE